MGQFRARLGRYAVGVGLLLAYQLAQFWFDRRLMHAIDVARLGDVKTASLVALSLVGLALVAFVVRVASRIAIFYAGRDAEYALRRAFLDKLYGLGPSFYAATGTGDLMSRATNDLTQVRLLLGFGVLNVVNTVLALSSALAVMLSISVELTAASMVSLPFLALVTRSFAKRIYARTRETQTALGSMSNTVQSSLTAIRVVRAFGLEQNEAKRFAADNENVLLRGLELAKLRGMIGPMMQAISALGVVVVFWYGGILLIEQRISAGGLLAFVRALTRLTWPLIALGFIVSIVQRGRAAYERLREVFDAPSEAAGVHATPKSAAPAIEARNLEYRVGERTLLRDIAVRIRAGERIAIVGTTGAGKSTLAKLLSRALPPPPGSVYLHGHDISELPLSEVRREICYSQQVPFLFTNTVAHNLTFALPETDSEAARAKSVAVAERVRIDSEIRQLVHGYDTVVGERGIQLSGGQRQRIALGRALLSSSGILVLDDPTSAVDVGTERALLDVLSEIGRERTLLIVTHRVSLASRCDRVLVLDAGKIVQQGTPAELAKVEGLYKTFCDEQRLESEIEVDPAPASVRSRPLDTGSGSKRDPAPPGQPAETLRAFHEESVLASAFNAALYRDLLRLLRPEQRLLVVAGLTAILIAVFGLLRPMFVRNAIDAAVVGRDAEQLAKLGVVVAILAVGEQLLGFGQSYWTQLAGARAMANLRERVFALLHRLPIAFFDKQPVGRLTTRVTNDVDAISELFASGALAAIGDLLRLVGIVALMVAMDVRLSISAFAALPFVLLLVLGLRRPMRSAFRAIRSQMARMNSALNEQISGMAVIQAFDKTARSAAEFDVINRANREAHLTSIRYESVQDAALETIASISLASMVFVFGYSGASFGTLLSFQLYLTQFFEPLSQLTQRYTLLQSAMAGAERVFGLLASEQRATPSEHLEGRPAPRGAALGAFETTRALPHVIRRSEVDSTSTDQPSPNTVSSGDDPWPKSAHAIVFEDVDFSYSPEVPVLHRLNLSIGVGEHVALVGPTGSGKSTVAALLIRLYEPTAGRISVMGQPIATTEIAQVRRRFAVVPQDPVLFPGTLLSNIAGADEVDRDRVRDVLERMRALEHFERRLGGLDAKVGTGGIEFSVGERQLVAFARALYRDAPILLLDEATASIDSDTEQCLQRALDASLTDRTAVVIAHRLSTIKAADRILVLQHGRLVQEGTHRELLQAEGLYRRLVALSSVRSQESARITDASGMAWSAE